MPPALELLDKIPHFWLKFQELQQDSLVAEDPDHGTFSYLPLQGQRFTGHQC
jgi:hypothetical protein